MHAHTAVAAAERTRGAKSGGAGLLSVGTPTKNAQKCVVIIDNTNMAKKDYEFYLKQARGHGATTVIVEVSSRTEESVGGSRGRSVHNVPAAALGRMRSRYEVDEAAVKLKLWARGSGSSDGSRGIENGGPGGRTGDEDRGERHSRADDPDSGDPW